MLPTTSASVPSEQLLHSRQAPSRFLALLQTTQLYLFTMARLAVAACCAICLFFFLVCIVSGHSSVFGHRHYQQTPGDHKTAALKSAESFRYDAVSEQQEAIDAILLKDSIVEATEKTSSKVSRRLNPTSRRHPANPTDRHRYSLMEQDNLSTDLADSYGDCAYHLAFTLIEQGAPTKRFTSKLMTKFRNSLSSILLNLNSTNLDSGALCVHLITDGSVRAVINDVIVRVHEELVQKSIQLNSNEHHQHEHGSGPSRGDHLPADQHRPLTKYFFIDSVAVESRLDRLLPTLRAFFTHKPNSYYSNALFFYSLVLHQIIPRQVADRLILLDVDVQLDANLLELYEEFGRFKPEQVIGIAHEQQPVYR